MYAGMLLGAVEAVLRGEDQDEGILLIAAVKIQAQFVIHQAAVGAAYLAAREAVVGDGGDGAVLFQARDIGEEIGQLGSAGWASIQPWLTRSSKVKLWSGGARVRLESSPEQSSKRKPSGIWKEMLSRWKRLFS